MSKEGDQSVYQFSQQYEKRFFSPVISYGIDALLHLPHQVIYIDPESQREIEKGRAIIIAAPHTSHIDGPIALRMLRDISPNIAPLVGADYWDPAKRPFVPELMRKFNFIPVERGAGVPQGMKVADWDDIGQMLQSGWNIFLFPEGTRDEEHRFQFEDGVAVLSRRYKAPIIPVGLSGVEDVLPKGKRVPRIRGVSVGMYVGKPIREKDISGFDDILARQKTEKFTRYLEECMKYMAQKADQLVDQAG